MLPTDICRTCARHAENLLALSTCIEKYMNKRISDMLHELTHKDVSNFKYLKNLFIYLYYKFLKPMELAADDLPQYLCEDCLDKLQNAYGFVLQAREVREQLLLKLRKELLRLQCLDETPIDMALQPIKTESDIEFGGETENADQMEDNGAVSPRICVTALKFKPEIGSENNHGVAE